MGPPQSTKNGNFLRRIVMYIFPVFFHPLWQLTWYLWVVDKLRHLGTLCWTLGNTDNIFTFFWHLRDQTMNLLIKKTINRLTDNESNHKLQPYCGLHPQPWMLQIWILRHCLKIFCCCPESISPSEHHSKKDVCWTCWQDASTCKQDQLWLFMLRISD